jgi:hypothetical protein
MWKLVFSSSGYLASDVGVSKSVCLFVIPFRGIIWLPHTSSGISLCLNTVPRLAVSEVCSQAVFKLYNEIPFKFSNEKNKHKEPGEKENKRRWKTNFWQWQRGSGPRDHVTFITAEQKTGGWIEGHPDTLEHLETTSLYRMHHQTSGELFGS